MSFPGRTDTQPQDPLAFDHDYHLDAQSVLAVTPDPQNPFEVAVVLSTLGYTEEAARMLGASGLLDLAQRVFDVIELHYRAPSDEVEELPEAWHLRFMRFLSAVAMGLSNAELWVLSLVLLVTTRVAFWSSTTLIGLEATAVNIALVTALIVSTPFVQSFSRKHVFFELQSNWPLARWTANLLIGTGAVVALVVLLGVYLLLENVLHVYTPGTNRLFLGFALLIAALNLVIAPLYTMRAYLALFVALVLGTAVIVIAMPDGWPELLDRRYMTSVQVVSMLTIVGVALVLSLLVRRRMEGRDPDPIGKSLRPRLGVFLFTTLPYAAYGGGLYVLVFAHKFYAGGLFGGHYSYQIGYEAAVGLAAIVIVPVLVTVTAAMERFPRDVGKAIRDVSMSEAHELGTHMRHLYRKRLLVLLAVVGVSALTVWVLGAFVKWPLRIPAGGMSAFPVALAGYSFLGVALFHVQWLFYISRPRPVLVGLGAGIAASTLLAIMGESFAASASGSVWGLLVGSALFAALTMWATIRSLGSFDTALYSSF